MTSRRNATAGEPMMPPLSCFSHLISPLDRSSAYRRPSVEPTNTRSPTITGDESTLLLSVVLQFCFASFWIKRINGSVLRTEHDVAFSDRRTTANRSRCRQLRTLHLTLSSFQLIARKPAASVPTNTVSPITAGVAPVGD